MLWKQSQALCADEIIFEIIAVLQIVAEYFAVLFDDDVTSARIFQSRPRTDECPQRFTIISDHMPALRSNQEIFEGTRPPCDNPH